MENSGFIELFSGALNKCPSCGSTKLLLFIESRIKDCLAWACWDCHSYEVRVKGETLEQRTKVIEDFFKNQNAHFDKSQGIPSKH